MRNNTVPEELEYSFHIQFHQSIQVPGIFQADKLCDYDICKLANVDVVNPKRENDEHYR